MTDTASAILQREREIKDDRFRRAQLAFRQKWAPADAGAHHEFEADLTLLLHEVYLAAVQPFADAAARQLQVKPLTPFVLTRDEG